MSYFTEDVLANKITTDADMKNTTAEITRLVDEIPPALKALIKVELSKMLQKIPDVVDVNAVFVFIFLNVNKITFTSIKITQFAF